MCFSVKETLQVKYKVTSRHVISLQFGRALPVLTLRYCKQLRTKQPSMLLHILIEHMLVTCIKVYLGLK